MNCFPSNSWGLNENGENNGIEVRGTSPVGWCSTFLKLKCTKPRALHCEPPEFVHLSLLRVSVVLPWELDIDGAPRECRTAPGAGGGRGRGKEGGCGAGTSAELRKAAASLGCARPRHLPRAGSEITLKRLQNRENPFTPSGTLHLRPRRG